jgi:O-antigen/teichoic acid export membrane protein
MTGSLRITTWLKQRLGPLGWGAIIVFLIMQCGSVAPMLCRLVLGRKLADFGGFDPVLSLVAILGLPVAILFQIATKSISRLLATGKHDEFRALLGDLMKVSAVGGALAAASIFIFRNYILERLHLSSGVYVWLIAGMFLLAWWQLMFQAVLQGALNYRVLLVSSLVGSFLLLFFTVTLVAGCGMQLEGAFLARILAGLVTIIVLLFVLRKLFVGGRSRYPDELALMKAMALPMSVYMASTTILFNFDRLFVRNFLLRDSSGYGAIVTVGSIPLYFIGSLVFVVFPLAAAEHAQGRNVALFLRKAVSLSLLVTAGCAAGFGLLAKPLMGFWNVTGAFVPYSKYVWIYSVAMGLNGTIQVVSSVEMARHRYGFLWFLAMPTLAMCAALYALKSTASIPKVLAVVVAAHAVILVGIWLFGIADNRQEPELTVDA